MGQVTIAITKRVAFRDSTQEFQNVYTYGSVALNPGNGPALEMIDEVVTKEKAIHSAGVSFVYGRLWSSGGSPGANEMIAEKALSGNGATADNVSLDRERAILVQWPAGTDTKGRPVRLKKWYHVCGTIGGVGASGNIMSGASGFTQAQRDAIAAAVQPLTRIVSAVWGLKAESGRERTGDGNAVAHRYLEHHQLGDQWRG